MSLVLLGDMNYNSDDVAILFSNRAACYLKIGDCRSCVTDCNTAMTMAPANCYKPLLRRALAYETMEKLVSLQGEMAYMHAYKQEFEVE